MWRSRVIVGVSLVSALAGTTWAAGAMHDATKENEQAGEPASDQPGSETEGVKEGPKEGPKEGAKAGAKEGVIDPRADAALHRMSNYLASLKTLKVETTTVDEHITTNGQKIQEIKDSKVALKRPGSMAIDRIGPFGRVEFRYDGKHFSLFGVDKHAFATAPAPANLDRAIDEARDRLHVDAPGGDLMVSDPYHALIEGVTEGRYIGLEPIAGVMAHHLAMTKGAVDWQIWIADGPEPVPLRYVITSKDMPGQPQFTIDLHNWQPDVPLSASAFAFLPPPDARQIKMGGGQ